MHFLSLPLWQAGMERVVYPGKLPIVYDRNSLWEGEPPEQGSEQRKKLNTEKPETYCWGLCASTGNWCKMVMGIEVVVRGKH